MQYTSSCRCQSVTLVLKLPNGIEIYQPRACDCDFCQNHGLAYISDPKGTLEITASVPLNYLQQGSKQASFMQCSQCEQIVAVTFETEKGLKGAAVIEPFTSCFKNIQYVTASPKQLNPGEKRQRWESLWLSVLIKNIVK